MKLMGREEYYRRFIDSISDSFGRRLWALIIDISGIDIGYMESFCADLPHFTNYCKKRKMPSMITLSVEQAVALDGRNWGMLVKGFEIKDLVVDCRPEGIIGSDMNDVHRLVRNVNEQIKRGKRLNEHMNTHYFHNDYIMTIHLGETTCSDDLNSGIIGEIAGLDLVKFRFHDRVLGTNKTDIKRLIFQKMKKSGKIYLDEANNIKMNVRIREESVVI